MALHQDQEANSETITAAYEQCDGRDVVHAQPDRILVSTFCADNA